MTGRRRFRPQPLIPTQSSRIGGTIFFKALGSLSKKSVNSKLEASQPKEKAAWYDEKCSHHGRRGSVLQITPDPFNWIGPIDGEARNTAETIHFEGLKEPKNWGRIGLYYYGLRKVQALRSMFPVSPKGIALI